MNAEINAESIAIVLTGNFNEQEPDRRQLAALKKTIDDLRAIYGDLEVIPHKDASATECPGKHLDEWLSEMYPRPEKLHKASPDNLERITSYNPTVEQNDESPCIGALGIDICHYAKDVQIIALSSDLVNKEGTAPFKYGEWVQITHPTPACNVQGVVLDTMHGRWRNAVDIFRMDRSKNHGKCTGGSIHKINKKPFWEMFPEQEFVFNKL